MSAFLCKKGFFVKNSTFTQSNSMRPVLEISYCSRLAKNRKNDNDVTIFLHNVIVKFFEVAVFLLSSLVTGPSFMSISLKVVQIWQFSFIWDWLEIWKSEVPPSEFCPISGDWGLLGIRNLARFSLVKSCWISAKVRVTTITLPEGKPTRSGKVKIRPTQIEVKTQQISNQFYMWVM